MSKTVDSRVVEMQFDNKHFESNVKTTMSTLDKLKQSLNLTGSYNSMSGLSEAVESVRIKFSALEVMAVTALANITNSAVNAGKRIVSALTIDPIKTGFQEYETQINAIQTVLANTSSKGTTLEQVNKALNELNHYADMTIYNFTEMTRNIGTFTAAGIDLNTSVSAIKGIANLAAVSGSTSQQASTAMYQLSQALASGTVKLMDWNSVVNAGMGGQVFQDALKDTARVHGIAIDQMIENEGSFRETLKDGWLTSEVLTETLAKFTGDLNEDQLRTMGYTEEQIKSIIKMGQTANDAATKVKTFTQLFDTLKEAAQSGWTKSWEIIVGDFEEAKELLTELSDIFGGIIGKSADARNEVLQGWKDLGGRTAVIEALRNAFESVISIITPIKEAFREIFPPITAEQLYSFSEGLRKLTEHLKLSEATSANLKSTFKGFFALLDIGRMALTAITGGFISLTKTLFPVTGNFLSVTGGIGDFIVAIRDALKSSNTFNVAIQNIGKVLKPVAEGIVMFTDLIASAFEAVRAPDMTGIDEFTGQIEKRFQPLIKIGEAFKSFLSFFYNLASTISKILSGLSASIFKSLNDANFNSIFDFINSGLFAGILFGIKKFIDSLTKITDSAGGFLSGITGIFDGVRGCLEAYQSNLKANVLLKIAIAIGILAAALLTISMIDSEKLTVSLGAMTIMFVELFAAMSAFSTLTGPRGFLAMAKITTGMIGLSVAVLILASAMQKLGNLDWDGVIKGLVGIAGLSVILIKVSKALETSSKSLISASVGFIVFGAAILILTQAVKQLGGLDLADLAKGLVGVGVLMAELVLFMKVADLSGMGAIKSVGILLLAAAITVLAGAVKKLSSINLGDLVKGLSGLAVMLASIAIFINVAGNAKKVIATAASLTILGVAMNIFAAAIIKMGGMSWEEMSRGLISLGSALAIVTLALMALPNGIFIKSLALMDVAGAMLLLSQALKAFSSMSWEEIAKSLTALIVSLGVIIGAFVLLSKTSSVVDSLAFSVLALSIVMLAGALKTIGSLSLAQIGIALLGLAGTFTVIGLASMLLTPAIPAILGLAAAIVLLGIGVAAIGGGILALSAGLSALAVAGTAGTVALVALVTGLIGLIPTTIKMIGEGIVAFAEVIAGAYPKLFAAMTTVLTAFIDAIIVIIPKVVDAFLLLITSLLESLVNYIPRIMQAGMEIIINFLQGTALMIPDVIQAGIDIIISIIDGLAQGIEENAPRIRDAFIHLFESLLKAILVFLGINSPSKVFTDIGTNIIQGLINGINNMLSDATKAIINVVTGLISAISNKMGEFFTQGKESMSNFKNGISNKLSDVKNAAINVVSNVLSGIGGKLSEFTSMGSNLINGLKRGIQNAASSAVSAAKGVVSDAISAAKNLLGIRSPSKVFADIGRYSDEGFVKGLKSYSSKVASASEDVGKSAIDGIANAISRITDALNSDMDMEPTIRPVLDLSAITSGADDINGLLSSKRSIELAGKNSMGMNNTASSNNQNNVISNNDNVVKAIGELRNDMSVLANTMSKLKIVMDTGTLVGALVGPLDSSFGQRVIYEGRGI
ncbi:MAG: tape measure protein [Dysgonamonadaceae bacterium]